MLCDKLAPDTRKRTSNKNNTTFIPESSHLILGADNNRMARARAEYSWFKKQSQGSHGQAGVTLRRGPSSSPEWGTGRSEVDRSRAKGGAKAWQNESSLVLGKQMPLGLRQNKGRV